MFDIWTHLVTKKFPVPSTRNQGIEASHHLRKLKLLVLQGGLSHVCDGPSMCLLLALRRQVYLERRAPNLQRGDRGVVVVEEVATFFDPGSRPAWCLARVDLAMLQTVGDLIARASG